MAGLSTVNMEPEVKKVSKKLKKKLIASEQSEQNQPQSLLKAPKKVAQNQLNFKRVGGGSLGRHPVVFSADAIHFMFSNSNSIHVYHTATSMHVRIIDPIVTEEEREIFHITALATHPERHTLIYSATSDGRIELWDFTTGELRDTWKVAPKIRAMKLHANTAYVITSRLPLPNSKEERSKPSNYLLRVGLNESKKFAGYEKLASVDNEFSGLDVSQDGKYVVVGARSYFKVVHTASKRVDKVNESTMTCLAIHPTEPLVAIGDALGRITLWYCLYDEERAPTVSALHWHAHAVQTIAFAQDGVTMLSGGEEAVLVIWQLPTRQATYIPRLGSPIFRISVSPDNMSYALCQFGNMVRIVSAVDQRTQQAVSGLRIGRIRSDSQLSTGLVLEPRNKLIALNGLPGSLQFLNSKTLEHVMELEVTPGNRVSRMDKNEIIRAHVIYVAFSGDGEWMTTVESRESGPNEQQLKFWRYDAATQGYSVNTRVDKPHDGNIMSLRMNTNSDTAPTCITTGDDNKFRLWGAAVSSEENDVRWACKFVGMYKSEKPTDAVISSDGSLLAVAEKHVVTLWDANSFTLQGVLTFPTFKSVVSKIAFAASSHYLYAATRTHLLVWNLLTCTVWWSVPMRVSQFVADPESSRLVVSAEDITTEGRHLTSRLHIFQPESPIPIASHDMKSQCVGATFLPNSTNVLIMDWQCALYLWGNTESNSRTLQSIPKQTSLLNNMFGESPEATTAASTTTSSVVVSAIPPLAFLTDTASHLLPRPTSMMASLMDLLLQPSRTKSSSSIEASVEENDTSAKMDVDDNDALSTEKVPDMRFLSETFKKIVSL
ncbi:hypothetical protein SmJEL517_g01657 [Synchytrium microbalum]|uniref:WD repeat-containing protein 75 second beta-propeller domain-containing protein n=1 Tax=Synchytrium microbalum TaxID=1806994 RepID=A0A507CF68_9FUNG|nr:uncharacterized protein SmJEL517_g01657 [Synchytrium microbalum]TPX36163.1 hypothetical protein SmJEL517_g01657 [Synchytrium microbalum]